MPDDRHATDIDGCGCWMLVLMLFATICAIVVIRVLGWLG